MKIQISDLLKLDAFSGASIVAGQKSVSRRIRSVSVMDALVPEDAARDNGVKEQLVLTSFSGVADEDTKIRMMTIDMIIASSSFCFFTLPLLRIMRRSLCAVPGSYGNLSSSPARTPQASSRAHAR